jgi:hypothetical protein
MGWSTYQGFFIYGPVSTADVQNAVNEALTRLRHGESQLAIHPHCGTNLVTGGALVGLLAFLTMLPGDNRSRAARLPLVLLVSTLALILAQPLGLLVQQHVTTDPHLGDASVAKLDTRVVANTPLHHIQLSEEASP